jgi:hypothetical protein
VVDAKVGSPGVTSKNQQIKLMFDPIRQLMEPSPAPKKKFGFQTGQEGNGGTKTKAKRVVTEASV